MKTLLIIAALFLGLSPFALAQHEQPHAQPAASAAAQTDAHHATSSPSTTPAHAEHPEALPHPAISADATWTRPTVIVIFAMFAAAIPVGMIIRARAPQEPAADHSHDDHSAHHGHDAHGHGGHH